MHWCRKHQDIIRACVEHDVEALQTAIQTRAPWSPCRVHGSVITYVMRWAIANKLNTLVLIILEHGRKSLQRDDVIAILRYSLKTKDSQLLWNCFAHISEFDDSEIWKDVGASMDQVSWIKFFSEYMFVQQLLTHSNTLSKTTWNEMQYYSSLTWLLAMSCSETSVNKQLPIELLNEVVGMCEWGGT